MKRKSDQYQKVLIAIIALYCVFVGAVNPAFLQVTTIFDIVRTASTSVILAIGLLVVMISGGIDVFLHGDRAFRKLYHDKYHDFVRH